MARTSLRSSVLGLMGAGYFSWGMQASGSSGSSGCRLLVDLAETSVGEVAEWRRHRGAFISAVRPHRAAFASRIEAGSEPNKDPDPPRSIQERLAAYGLSGVASYGLFNTLYYVVSGSIAVATIPRPAVDTLAAALQHVLKLLAVVWAGSQVTKLPRAACALACAPLMDRLLDWISKAVGLKGGKRSAFLFVLVPFCWGLFFTLLAFSVLFVRSGYT